TGREIQRLVLDPDRAAREDADLQLVPCRLPVLTLPERRRDVDLQHERESIPAAVPQEVVPALGARAPGLLHTLLEGIGEEAEGVEKGGLAGGVASDDYGASAQLGAHVAQRSVVLDGQLAKDEV